jgi:hypothetical protein
VPPLQTASNNPLLELPGVREEEEALAVEKLELVIKTTNDNIDITFFTPCLQAQMLEESSD